MYYNKITTRHGYPMVEKELGIKPIPPFYVWTGKGEWTANFPLVSTNGGGAQWGGQIVSNKYLSWGRYSPYYRAIIRDPKMEWHMWVRYYVPDDPKKDAFVWQRYLPGYNRTVALFQVWGKEVRPFPEDAFLHKKIAEIQPNDPDWTQGHLSVFSVQDEGEQPFWGNDAEPLWYYSTRVVLNHYLLDSRLIAKERENQVFYGLIIVPEDRGWIVSADHPDEPIELRKGVYVIAHPEPQDNID